MLTKVACNRTATAEVVGRARSLLAVADTANFAAGARAGGRKSGYGVAKLVARFNIEGLKALQTKPSHGHRLRYSVDQRAQVIAEFQRAPDREGDGTGTWSLTTLQRALRKKPGMEKISRDTICEILHGTGLTWQRDRTWCATGTSVRKGKDGGKRIVVDPDAEAKKFDRPGVYGKSDRKWVAGVGRG